MSFEVSSETLKVMIRKDIWLINSGRIEFDAVFRRAELWRNACRRRGIFCDWPSFQEFLLTENLNEEIVEDIEVIWEEA
jgi:hypothetical protein